MGAIVEAVGNGYLTVSEAAEVSKLVETFIRSLEATEFHQRLRVLEERVSGTREA
jgi:hypothetical protein